MYTSHMSAVPRHPGDSGYVGQRMNADEYLSLGETSERYELIDGVVVMSPSTSDEHSEVAIEVATQLHTFAKATGSIRVFADIDTRFSSTLVYRPDVLVYLTHRLQKGVSRRNLAPDLVVEILSPGNRSLDLITKRRDYDRFGVGEYWIIDPELNQIRVLPRKTPEGPYVESLATDAGISSAAIAGFVLDLAPIQAIIASDNRTSSDEA